MFPRRGGRWPELGNRDDREWVGRFLGRIHAVGRAARFQRAARLIVEELGRDARDFVLDGDWMPDYLATKYADVTDELLEEVEARAARLGWRTARADPRRLPSRQYPVDRQGPHFVDLDDCLTGPAIQDLWMLLAGGQQDMRTELHDLLDGYRAISAASTAREIALIEPLRALRMIHYSRVAGAALA